MVSTPRLVGGISSSARALPSVDGTTLQIERSAGPYLWDTEGRRYVDTALGYGGTVLGHAPASVIAAVEEALFIADEVLTAAVATSAGAVAEATL